MFRSVNLVLKNSEPKCLSHNGVIQALKRKVSTNEQAVKPDKYQELKKMGKKPLYLDAQATTPVDPRVLDAMLPYMTNMYGNPHSRTHAYGWESEKAVETAREVLF